jgi:hypothetical protein
MSGTILALLTGDSGLQNQARKWESHLQSALSITSREPLNLAAMRSFIWTLSELPATAKTLETSIRSVLYKWHQFMWRNAYGMRLDFSVDTDDGPYGFLSGVENEHV